MQSVCVCRTCGRTIETNFLYCPWCGQSRIEESASKNLDEMFSRLEQVRLQHKVKHIEKLDAELAALEKDLDTLVLSVEMHK